MRTIIMAIIMSLIYLGLPIKPSTLEQINYPTSVPHIDLSPYRGCFERSWKDDSYLNGFIDQWGYCIPGFVTNETWFRKQPDFIYGTAVWYTPWVMEATAKKRGMAYPEEYVGGVALGSPAEMGETVWLFGPLGWEGPFLVVDCPQHVDVFTTVVVRQQAVEVDFETALRWGMVQWRNPYDKAQGYDVLKWSIEPVMVYKGDELPEDIMFRKPIYFADWWLERAEFAEKTEPKPFWKNTKGNTLLWRFDPTDYFEEWVCLTCD